MEHEGVKRVCGISGDNATGSEMVGGESRKKNELADQMGNSTKKAPLYRKGECHGPRQWPPVRKTYKRRGAGMTWREDIPANLFADNSPSRDEVVAALSDVDGFVARISAEYNRELTRYTLKDNSVFFNILWKKSQVYEQQVWDKWLAKNMEEHVGDDADEERRVDIARAWLRNNLPSELRVNHRNHTRADKIRKDLSLYQQIHTHIPTKVEETTEDPDDLLFHDVNETESGIPIVVGEVVQVVQATPV